MKLIKFILSVIIIIASVILCHQIISNSISNQQNKNDYAELNHIKYGLLNVDEWKSQITAILSDEIKDLKLSRPTKQELRKHIEVLLDTLIDKVDRKIKEGNTGSVKGWVKQSIINTLINLDDVKEGIPEYADAVIYEMTRSKTRGQVKELLNKQLEQYSNNTFEMQDTSQRRRILLETESKDIESARIKIDKLISVKHELVSREVLFLIILSITLFMMYGLSRQPLIPSGYLFLVISLLSLLIAGVTTPMIDLEAKISTISFMLMGHPIHFENQVLYFQSKSIFDVFRILILDKAIQMKFVGILIVTFSIIFPLLKIISSMVYYYNYHNAKENPVIKFFVLKSGKWSMADVMVVAIFMAYIGFNGIITSQLGQLSSTGQEVVILATNGTSLQPGYYLFLTYTLLALFLSGFLKRKHLDHQAKE